MVLPYYLCHVEKHVLSVSLCVSDMCDISDSDEDRGRSRILDAEERDG
jgi:hypothetical protein